MYKEKFISLEQNRDLQLNLGSSKTCYILLKRLNSLPLSDLSSKDLTIVKLKISSKCRQSRTTTTHEEGIPGDGRDVNALNLTWKKPKETNWEAYTADLEISLYCWVLK